MTTVLRLFLLISMLLVFLIVPPAVLLVLGFSAAAGVLSLAAALSPLLLMGALALWIFRRSAPPAPPSPAPGQTTGGPVFAPGSTASATKD